MSDLISRKAAIEALAKAGCINYEATGDTYGMITAINVIKGMPAAEITTEGQKRGTWVDYRWNPIDDWTGYCATCSCCGEDSEYLSDYCPNCGAKMVKCHDGRIK